MQAEFNTSSDFPLEATALLHSLVSDAFLLYRVLAGEMSGSHFMRLPTFSETYSS